MNAQACGPAAAHNTRTPRMANTQDGNGLWYTDDYTKQQWIDSLSTLARRYAASSAVVGHGLRNEPRPTVVNGGARGLTVMVSSSPSMAAAGQMAHCAGPPATGSA
jgi:hypothetical protein